MKRFPGGVRRAMRETGSDATCMSIRLDDADWESALFIRLVGKECAQDRLLLRRHSGVVPVGVETDLIEEEHGAVVLLRLEVYTFPQDPLALEILITPGGSKGQFETLRRLSIQARLCWFFADDDFRVFHAQQHALLEEQNNEFRKLVDDAVKHDAVVRCTGRYDARAALQSVAAHYELRAAVSSRNSRASTDEVGFRP